MRTVRSVVPSSAATALVVSISSPFMRALTTSGRARRVSAATEIRIRKTPALGGGLMEPQHGYGASWLPGPPRAPCLSERERERERARVPTLVRIAGDPTMTGVVSSVSAFRQLTETAGKTGGGVSSSTALPSECWMGRMPGGAAGSSGGYGRRRVPSTAPNGSSGGDPGRGRVRGVVPGHRPVCGLVVFADVPDRAGAKKDPPS